MQRILYVHHCPEVGGATMSLLYLIERLDRRRYTPSILFNAPPGGVEEQFARLDVPVYHDPSITTYPHAQGALLQLRSLRPWEVFTRAAAILPSAGRFARFLRENPQDLVHLNSAVQVPAAIGARHAGVPVIWHLREELHPGVLGVRRAAVRRCIDRCAAAVVAISRRNAEVLGLPGKGDVVYNFVDFDRFDRNLDPGESRRALGLPHDRPVVLMLGGVVSHKGAEVLVEAASHVRAARPGTVFVVAGFPPTDAESPSALKRALRRGIESTGLVRNVPREVLARMNRHRLHETVRFVGMRSDVPRLLAASDLLVWPATVSHFSRPVIEAGAMARPVVASDFPAARELVDDGATGLLVRPERPVDLAAGILKVLSDPEAARRMGEAGYRLARERYDARRNAESTFAIYERVLSGRAGRRPAA